MHALQKQTPQPHHTNFNLTSDMLDKGYRSVGPHTEHSAMYLDNKAYSLTMHNYRIFAHAYNESVKEYNSDVVEPHNAKFKLAVEKGLNDIQLHYRNILIQKHWNESEREIKNLVYSDKREKAHTPQNTYVYNEIIEDFCKDHGYCLPLKKVAKLHYGLESTFSAMLSSYRKEIYTYSLDCQRNPCVYLFSLRPMSINTHNISTNFRPNGVRYHALCKRQVYEHRRRLEESQVLVNGRFRGREKSRIAYLNQQILVLFCPEMLVNSKTDYQLVTSYKRKKLQDNDVSTLHPLDNLKTSDVHNITNEVSLALNQLKSNLAVSYLHTRCNVENSQPGPATQNVKKTPFVGENERNSKKLADAIQEPGVLCADLAAGKHTNSLPMDMQLLENEVNNGNLDRDQFKILLVQQLLMVSGILYAGKNVFVGAWYNAYELIINYLYNYDANTPHHKYKQLELHKLHLAAIMDQARHNQRKNWNNIYPSKYFDPLRREYTSNGFAYRMILAEKRAKRADAKKIEEQNRKKQAIKRSEMSTDQAKITRKISSFLSGSIKLWELQEYVKNNLHPDFKRDLNYHLERVQKMHGKKFAKSPNAIKK